MKIILYLFLFSLLSCDNTVHEKQIKNFIESELKYYPEAQLVDLYKNYFQDAYGPGHIVPDTLHAGKYLDWELQQKNWTDTLLYQALGINHDYYRINLNLVKNGSIPRDTMLFALVESAPLARKPTMEDWKKEWSKVLAVIKKDYPNIPNLEEDEKRINEVFSKDDVVMHHSNHYVETYNPHYRIVHRSVFLRWKKKYLF